jgi:hypothetical protein
MRHKPEHTCISPCAACAYELGVQEALRKPSQTAKYVWMVEGSNNPCDIRRYAFSHEEGVSQLSHRKQDYKDYTGGKWRLYKLVPVNRKKTKKP